MATSERTVLARVTGQVQGVSFRSWVRAEAEMLGVTGWVRNERDGSVTALIAGSNTRVAQMVEALWEGPAAASVHYVATEEVALFERPQGFEIALPH